MTLLEIKDERTKLLDENDSIVAVSKEEKRTKTEAELGIMQRNIARLKELDMEEANENFKQPVGAEIRTFAIKHAAPKEEFSLVAAIRDTVENRNHNDVTRDYINMGRKEFSKAGVNAGGGIVIPVGATYLRGGKKEKRAAILAGTATQGQEIVAEDKRGIIPPLADKLVLAKAGATIMSGLVGNVSIPSYAGTTVAWKTEIEAAADGGGAFSEVVFTPKRLTAYLDVSKLFLAQDGVGAERLLLDNIAAAVARMLEKTILGPATLAAGYPSGIGYKLNVANGGGVAELDQSAGTLTYAAMVGLESTVDASNAMDGNLCYITNSIGRGLLKSTDKGTANDTGDMLCSEDNFVNGYPLLVTNSIVSTYGSGGAGNMLAFGNWADLCIGQWGGYDITVDPYSLAYTNQVRIVINSYFDAKGLRGSTGAGVTLDEYAYSFAALSMKA